MEKILLGLDVLQPDRNTIEFACYLARLTKSKLSAIFLHNIPGSLDPEMLRKNIAHVCDKCIGEETPCYVHDKAMPGSELIRRSRFVDLVVLDPETSLEKTYEGSPTKFVSEVLEKTECPVMLAPESFQEVEEIFFAYNNSASAVFAIKQFTYLFPQLRGKNITIMQAGMTGAWGDDRAELTQWLSCHYTHLNFIAVANDPETALFDQLLLKRNCVIVMGAYGRSVFSRFFKRSRAERLIKVVTQPIFITHL